MVGALGIILSLSIINGEIWIAVDPTTNAMSFITFSSGLNSEIGLIMLGINMIMLYLVVVHVWAVSQMKVTN